MNLKLTSTIIEHIFCSLLMIKSDFIKTVGAKSLLDKDFLLDQTLNLNDSVNNFYNKVWSCQSEISGKKIFLLVADCSLEKDIKEYSLIVKLEDAPIYGCYLVLNENYNSDALIACTLDGKNWMECNTYLQATFLAGMEQIKELNSNWNKVINYEQEFNLLKSFLSFHNSIYGEITDER